MKARRILLAAAIACIFPAGAAAAASPQAQVEAAKPYIAVVNGRKVTREEFERTFSVVARQKFYHRAPPEGQLEQARLEVAESLVERALVLGEAEKRGLPVDEAAIQKVLDGYEKQYGSSPDWKTIGARALPQIRIELAQQQLLTQLEAGVRDVPTPDAAAVRAFYDANPPLFTQPERVRVSVILLKVDPAAPKATRDQVREEGRELRERLAKGADFAVLAKIQSGDGSAAKGGDLGYLHRGMLPEAIHKEIDALEAGELSPSFDVLEGVTVFKLHERELPKLRDFESSKSRAQDLVKREQSESAWKAFVAGLRRDAVIETFAPLHPAPVAIPGAPEKDTAWAATDKTRGP